MNRGALSALIAGALAAAIALPAAVAQEGGDRSLKQRFKDRYPALEALRDAGKVGETFDGFAAAVESRFLDEPADPDAPDGRTIRELLAAENRDREILYRRIAEETGTTPEKVGRRNALRVFERAGPNDYFRLESGAWKRKKELKSLRPG